MELKIKDRDYGDGGVGRLRDERRLLLRQS